MFEPWDQARVQQLIDDEIEESLTLEYKAPPALGRTDKKKREITKDVSALANSAGGTIIYGVSENNDPDKRHRPAAIDPVDRSQYAGEWLQQVINLIRPKIKGLIIHPVGIDDQPSQVVYVIEVPSSVVPHQALDHKYYKRFNFQSEPMEDYEIQDIRRRRKSFSQLVRFEVVSRDMLIEFMVSNPGDMIAEDVRFDFLTPLKWRDGREEPKLFAQGSSYLSPGQRFRFFYAVSHEIFSDEQAPKQLAVDVSYFHPALGKRVVEPFRLDFEDYMNALVERDSLHKLGKTLQDSIDKLTRELKAVRNEVGKLTTIAGPSGMDLSASTVQNLRSILGDEDPPKLDPRRQESSFFREVLGVDAAMASRLRWHFLQQQDAEDLIDLEGMDDALLQQIAAKLRL